MKTDLREIPVEEPILEHTGRPAGDDAGYRDVPGSELDNTNPDPLVAVNDLVACHATYALGEYPGVAIWPAIPGAISEILLRAPAARAAVIVDSILAPYNRRLLIVDGYRPAEVQAALWNDVLRTRVAPDRDPATFTTAEMLEFGTQADDIAAYNKIVQDDTCGESHKLLTDLDLEAIMAWAEEKDMPPLDVSHLLMSFRRCAGLDMTLTLDVAAPTAHGAGGAIDCYMLDTQTQKPVNMGVPFDHVGEESAMRWFETHTLREYREKVRANPNLQRYLAELGVESVTEDDFQEIVRNRRLLYHAFTGDQVQGTHYIGECWHFNVGNLLNGNQARELPNGGNSCHSLLRNVRDANGQITAAWTNATAYELSRPWYSTDSEENKSPSYWRMKGRRPDLAG